MVILFAIKALKLLLLSAGLISTLLLIKAYSSHIVFSSLIELCTSFKCFFSSPLYICIIINSIVMLIAASSTFHRHKNDNHEIFSTNPPPITKGIELFARNLSDDHKENEETIEATWDAINGGKSQRTKRKHLKKSETLNVPPQDTAEPSDYPSWKELRKSETFNDAVSIRRIGGLRRDPSMSIHELNKQVEDFINKFNDNMRLQRQESDQRFLDMINRGM